MLTIEQLMHDCNKGNLSQKRFEDLCYKKFLNKDLTNEFPFLETFVEVLNVLNIEYEYSLYYNVRVQTNNDPFLFQLLFDNQLKNTYLSHYPNRSLDISDNFNYTYIVYVPYLVVTLHFPKFIITNALNKSKAIKDFFVRFYIDENGSMRDSSLEATRTTYTRDEITAGYRHSHLPSLTGQLINSERWLSFNPMCLGTNNQIHTAMAFLYDSIKNKMNKDEISSFFELFIRNVMSVIEYESLEGTPYIKMSVIDDIAKQTKMKTNPYMITVKSWNYLISYVIGNSNFIELEKYIDNYNGRLCIQNNDEVDYLLFDDIVNNNFENISNELKDFIQIEVEGRILDLNKVQINDVVYNNKFIKFNGKKYFLTIDDTIKVEENNYRYVFLKEFKNYVKQIIQNRYLQRIIKDKQASITIPGSEADSEYCPF